MNGDTGLVPIVDIEGARAALARRSPAELIGLAECGWLDAKDGVYQLDNPVKAEELSKDVAGFANAGSGGLLLVGFSTRKEHDREILDEVRPVPRALVDLDRHRKLIRERVIPAPRGVSVKWIDCGNDSGVLVIDVPAQPPARVPYVIPGPTRTSEVSRLSVAVPVREADATVWLPQTEVQRLIAAGWTATGGPSEEFLSDLIEQAVRTTRRESPLPKPAIEIGEGEPGWKGVFQQAHNDLLGHSAWIGEPATRVIWEGPEAVQYFESPNSLFGWVLCALPNRRAVVVAGEIWRALQRAGSCASSGEPFAAIGFPVPAADATRAIDAQVTSIDLDGGQWGEGRLKREAGREDWCWEPAVRYSMNMTRAAGFWTADRAARQLRLRAIATLPWADAHTLTIASERRLQLEQALPVSGLAGLVTTLSLRRGGDLRAAVWDRGPNRNSLDALSYSSLITAADGRVALMAEVMIALPNSMNDAVVTCAELLITDLAAWAEALTASGAPPLEDLLLSMGEVTEFFTVAWHTATETLAAVVTNGTAAKLWTYPPTIELRLSAERRYDNTPSPQPLLDEYIDFSPLGRTDRDQIREMAVTITAPPKLDPSGRRSETRKALTYMAQQFGFLDATPTNL